MQPYQLTLFCSSDFNLCKYPPLLTLTLTLTFTHTHTYIFSLTFSLTYSLSYLRMHAQVFVHLIIHNTERPFSLKIYCPLVHNSRHVYQGQRLSLVNIYKQESKEDFKAQQVNSIKVINFVTKIYNSSHDGRQVLSGIKTYNHTFISCTCLHFFV